jgi:hypothetical protein
MNPSARRIKTTQQKTKESTSLPFPAQRDVQDTETRATTFQVASRCAKEEIHPPSTKETQNEEAGNVFSAALAKRSFKLKALDLLTRKISLLIVISIAKQKRQKMRLRIKAI